MQTERSDRERSIETLCRIEPTVAAARELALRLFGLARRVVTSTDSIVDCPRRAPARCQICNALRQGLRLICQPCEPRSVLHVEQRAGSGPGQLAEEPQAADDGKAELDLMGIRPRHLNWALLQGLRERQIYIGVGT
jgi:hypothetical protein